MRRFFVPLLGVILTATGMQAQSNPFDALRNPGDARLYEEHKAQWLARVEALPRNVDVLEGAADFFIIRDRPLAQGFLERARDLEPESPRWPRKLAQLHKLNATRGDQSEARLALAEMERADAMTPANERSLPTALAEMAFDAGDIPKARAYADQLLTLAKASPKSWDYGNAVHKGHLVLGRIAVREGRIVDAVGLLRASGETPDPRNSTRLVPTCRWRKIYWSTARLTRCWPTSSCAVCSGRWAAANSMPGCRRSRRDACPTSAQICSIESWTAEGLTGCADYIVGAFEQPSTNSRLTSFCSPVDE